MQGFFYRFSQLCRGFLLLLIGGSSLSATVTTLPAQNLVPNPGFESVKQIPKIWLRDDQEFAASINWWTSATLTSPDVIFDKTRTNLLPERNHFDLSQVLPRSGRLMAGIRVYGCNNFVIFCREYLETPLKFPLKPGTQYTVSFWLHHAPQTIGISNMGVAFSEGPIKQLGKETVLAGVTPVHETATVLEDSLGWREVRFNFIPAVPYQYLLIGNFRTDDQTGIGTKHHPENRYAYYLVDDVAVQETSTYRPVARLPLTFSIPNLEFLFDQDILTEPSRDSLTFAYDIIRQYPEAVIELVGHTDSRGGDAYNMDLSQRRALAVKNYLVERGIGTERIRTDGRGLREPISENVTDEGPSAKSPGGGDAAGRRGANEMRSAAIFLTFHCN